jgi:hypothetical protein
VKNKIVITLSLFLIVCFTSTLQCEETEKGTNEHIEETKSTKNIGDTICGPK